MKKIILTGGGTAGHVTPNIALLPKLKGNGYEVEYVGSFNGMEKELIEKCNITYHGISSGKLRRYMSIENFTDIFNTIKGISDAKKIIKKVKPGLIFSKGGFVSVPIIIAGRLCKIPVIIHESDITPGLANKIAIPFAAKVCVSFPETLQYLPKGKGLLTGPPIRESILEGSRQEGLRICGFDGNKPILLVAGGSLGSVKINTVLREILDKLTSSFDVVHICGKNNKENSLEKKGYKQFEYLSEELAQVFACADLIVSRAGSNSIFEFLALKKPNLLIPLSKNASRGDQILNSESFEKSGFSKVLLEEDLTEESLFENIQSLYKDRGKYISNMNKATIGNGIDKIIDTINENYKKN